MTKAWLLNLLSRLGALESLMVFLPEKLDQVDREYVAQVKSFSTLSSLFISKCANSLLECNRIPFISFLLEAFNLTKDEFLVQNINPTTDQLLNETQQVIFNNAVVETVPDYESFLHSCH